MINFRLALISHAAMEIELDIHRAIKRGKKLDEIAIARMAELIITNMVSDMQVIQSRNFAEPISQAARQIGVPTKWLSQEVKEGRMPGVKAGNTTLVHVYTVRKILAKLASQSPPTEDEQQAQKNPAV